MPVQQDRAALFAMRYDPASVSVVVVAFVLATLMVIAGYTLGATLGHMILFSVLWIAMFAMVLMTLFVCVYVYDDKIVRVFLCFQKTVLWDELRVPAIERMNYKPPVTRELQLRCNLKKTALRVSSRMTNYDQFCRLTKKHVSVITKDPYDK